MMRARCNFKSSGNVYNPGVCLSTSQWLLEMFCPDSTVVALAFHSHLQSYQRASQSNILMCLILISFLL